MYYDTAVWDLEASQNYPFFYGYRTIIMTVIVNLITQYEFVISIVLVSNNHC